MISYSRALFITLLSFTVAQSCASGDPIAEPVEDLEIAQLITCLKDGNKCSTKAVPDGVCFAGDCLACVELDKAGTIIGPLNCNDRNSCTEDSCEDYSKCVNKPLRNGMECGGGVCFDGACCTGCVDKDAGACTANGTPSIKDPAVKLCGVGGATCEGCKDDGNPCTDDICNSDGKCEHPPKADGVSCDTDGDVCNGTNACYKGECVPGKPLQCTSNNPCVTASCDKVKGCVTQNNTDSCNDGNPCTVNDRCSDGACRGGTTLSCDDNNDCTSDRCDQTHGCVHEPLAATETCDDRNDCTEDDRCDGNGRCVGTGASCPDDGNPCTYGAGCDCITVQEAPGTACSTGNKCLVNTTCNADGECAGGAPKDCNDNNPCTQDSCNPDTGECVSTPLSAGGCSDDSACTTNDHCEDGTCVGEPIECTAIDDCHEVGSCDAGTGLCNDPRREDGVECQSGSGTCKSGACVAKPGDDGEGGSGNDEPTAGAPSTDGGANGNSEEDGGTGGATDDENGAAGEAVTEGGASSAGRGSGTTGNRAGHEGNEPDPARGAPFVRKGGGCATSSTGAGSSGFALLALLGAGVFAARRRRGAWAARRPHDATQQNHTRNAPVTNYPFARSREKPMVRPRAYGD